MKELYHCDAVFQHRRPKTRYLSLILYGFHPLHGRLFLNDFRGRGTILPALAPHHLIQRIVHLIGIEQDIVFKVCLQPLLHLLVVFHADAFCLQTGRHLWSQFCLIDI